ncbi:MAG: hypothetical protein GX235_00025 [Clostridiales bacterium]|nr:hypothetical protein [Clostridiales bacterium]
MIKQEDIGDVGWMERTLKFTLQEKINMNWEELFFYLFFSSLLFTKGIGLIEGQRLYTIGILAGAGFWVLKVVLTRYSPAEYFVSALLGVLSFVAFLNTGEKGILFFFMLLLGMKDISVKKVFKLGLCIWTFTFFGIILIHLLGISNDLILAHDKLGLGHILRYSLGFPHPNVLQISYVIFMMFFFYVFQPKGKWAWISAGLLFIGDCYIFLYSVSYTGFVLSVVYLIARCYLIMRKNITKFEGVCIQMVLPFCALLSIAGPVVFQGKLFDIFNKILNTRFNLSRYFLTHQKITLFGSPLVDAPRHFVIDCSYVSCLLLYGVILFAFIMAAYFFMIRRYLKEDRREELAIIIGILVAGASEPFLFNTSFKNLSVIFIGSCLFGLLEEKKGDKLLFAQGYCIAELAILILASGMENGKELVACSLEGLKKNIVKWSAISILIGILASGIYAFNWERPSAIYMPISQSDEVDQEPVFIDKENLPENFDAWILQNNDKDIPMAKFSGNMITVEHVRTTVSCFIIVYIFCMIVITVGMGVRKKLVNVS